jgi:hypothetical protein
MGIVEKEGRKGRAAHSPPCCLLHSRSFLNILGGWMERWANGPKAETGWVLFQIPAPGPQPAGSSANLIW